jgi:hypothetical protein
MARCGHRRWSGSRQARSLQRLGSGSARSVVSAVRSRHRYHRRAASCTRIKHLVTCRSQYHMHLLLFAPPPGLAHLPTQFAARSSHRGALVTASVGELRSIPILMRVIAKERCRAMFEPPEKGGRATLNPNLSTKPNLPFYDQAFWAAVGKEPSRLLAQWAKGGIARCESCCCLQSG